MDLFLIPRRMARLQYTTARLPFIVLEEYVVPRHWNGQALLPFRLGFSLFLGSMDGFAGWLLADDRIPRRGQENLQAARATARQAGRQPHEGINIAAADQQARRKAQAHATAEQAPAEQAAGTRAAAAGQTAQAARIPTPAGRDQAGAAASQQRPDAAGNHRLVRYRPGEPPAPASSP